MPEVEPKDIAEIVAVQDESDFREFQRTGGRGLSIVPQVIGESKELALAASAGDFAKWLKMTAPDVPVLIRQPENRLVLRSGDYWLPLVFLANDVALPFYLNLVSSYIYDKMKGALKTDRARIRLSAVYEDSTNGIVKRFDFEGSEDALRRAVKRFDVNKFFEG